MAGFFYKDMFSQDNCRVNENSSEMFYILYLKFVCYE